MWNTINESLSNFCGSNFWDYNRTWNTSDPEFTVCFEKTVLVWVPCAFLWLLLPWEIHQLRRTNAASIPFNLYNVSKLIVIFAIGVISFLETFRNAFGDETLSPASTYVPPTKLLTFCLFFALTYASIKCGVRSSITQFLFSFLLVICGAPEFRTSWRLLQGYGRAEIARELPNPVLYIIYFLLIIIILILNWFADDRPIIRYQSAGQNMCPECDSAPVPSRLFFSWYSELVWKGYKKPLKDDDMWDLDDDMCTAQLVRRFETQWHRTSIEHRNKLGLPNENADHYSNENIPLLQKHEHTKSGKDASVVFPILRVFIGSIFAIFLLGLVPAVLNNINPQILKLILGYIDNQNEYLWHGHVYAFLILVVSVLNVIFTNFLYHVGVRMGLQVRTALASLIYKKTLKLSSGARRDFTMGEIVNLMAVDTQRFVLLALYCTMLFPPVVEIVISAYFLWANLGPSTIAGAIVLGIIFIINSWSFPRLEKKQVKQMEKKDSRIKLTNEVLSGMKVLKFYACEPSFGKRIAQIREGEIYHLKYGAYYFAVAWFTWVCTPFLISFFTFSSYVLSSEDHILTAQITFVSLSLFNNIKIATSAMVASMTQVVQTRVAVQRINKFLNSEVLDTNAVSHEKRYESVVIQNGTFSWESFNGPPVLWRINMEVRPTSLVAVVGSVGAGKSSLLSAILGEMYKKSGFVNTTGSIAYVPQQAWIQNATLRNNITFGSMKKKSYYNRILEACALLPDLKILSGGDKSEIGEKGVNISGGQKQRISLARAVYADADVYLLDDPLSAVDAHVGKHIFDQVIGPNGLLCKKARIFVTHNLMYLPHVDYIIMLENGRISASGTYGELVEKDFLSFLATDPKESEEDTDVEETIRKRKRDVKKKLDSASNYPVKPMLRRRTFSDSSINLTEPDDDSGNIMLTEEEEASEIQSKWAMIKFYFNAINPLAVFFVILLSICYQVSSVSADYWLSDWSSEGDGNQRISFSKQFYYMGIYALLGLGQALSVMLEVVILNLAMLKASTHIHHTLLNSVFQWPVSTFDRIPSGRIINRFGFDVDVLDNILPKSTQEVLMFTAMLISSIFVICNNTPMFTIVLVPLGIMFYYIQKIYSRTSRQLKRLEGITRSPIYSHFGDTVAGAQSIRAYDLQDRFIDLSEKKFDANLRCAYLSYCGERWYGMRLELLAAVIIYSVALFAILSKSTINAALVGLSINYSFQVTKTLFPWIMKISEVVNNVISIDRIKEYSEMEKEAPWVVPNVDYALPLDWPNTGEVVFRDLKLRYRSDLDLVLRGINFTLSGGQKVGVVGRTGAGKSSLTLCLFRIVEAADGNIFIDNVDVSRIGLHTLRRRLTIIPQDPTLFSGSLRMNLDPGDLYSDEDIWNALDLSNLKSYVKTLSHGLDHEVDEGGNNFSVGQRQLICLARALLRKTKILILDEATAAVDFETDDLIQKTIRKEFDDCTIITIAHRLNTVLDYDRIMVLDRGRIVEFDTPKELLESEESYFYGMAKDAGLV